MSRNSFVFRLIGVLLLIGLLAGGGITVYRAGVAHGIAQAPEVAEAIQGSAGSGQFIPPMYAYGYPYGHGFGHPYFFNPFGAICFSILFLFLFFGALRIIFFRHMRHSWGHQGHWRKDWEGGVPPFFERWHKRAHGEGDGDGEKSAETNKKE
ncbi:MAG TPA: hypothetical protein DCY14_03070 [Anaerolineae bacterium]|nr:hypothetical protein [Anaerolineae bacterium]HRJ56063.1 hypothetical protein [Anaerolineales bacterium]